MQDCLAASTPLDHSQNLSQLEKEVNSPDTVKFPYQEAVGSILYLSQTTRPDICFAATSLSMYNTTFQKMHVNAVKKEFKYLKGTDLKSLVFNHEALAEILGYCDADWANDRQDRRSISGYIFLFKGAPISWSSKKQKTVALSTCKAEYMSLALACQEAIWLRNLSNEINNAICQKPITIYLDNQSVKDLAETSNYKPRTKHIDVRYHFVRQCVDQGIIQIKHVPTQDMLADFLTKPLSLHKHQTCSDGLGLIDWN